MICHIQAGMFQPNGRIWLIFKFSFLQCFDKNLRANFALPAVILQFIQSTETRNSEWHLGHDASTSGSQLRLGQQTGSKSSSISESYPTQWPGEQLDGDSSLTIVAPIMTALGEGQGSNKSGCANARSDHGSYFLYISLQTIFMQCRRWLGLVTKS